MGKKRVDVVIGAKDEYTKAINKANADWDKFGKNIGSFIKKGAAVATAAIAGLSVALGVIIKDAANTGDELQKMALKLGISTEALSGLKFAAEIAGSNIEDVEKGIKGLAKRMSDARFGLETYKRVFRELNVEYLDSTGKLRDVEKVFIDSVEAINRLGSETEKTALAQDLFGRAGVKLLPLIKEGKSGITALMEEAKKLGIVYTQLEADQSAAFNDALLRLKKSISGLFKVLALDLIPAFTNLFDRITDFITKNDTLVSAIHKGTAAFKELFRIIGIDLRTELQKLTHEMGQLEAAAMKAEATSLNDNSVAAQRYTELLIQKAFLLRQDRDVLDLHTESTNKNTTATVDGFEKQKTALQSWADDFTSAYANLSNVVDDFEKRRNAANEAFIANVKRADAERLNSTQSVTSQISSFEQNLSVAVGNANEAAFTIQKAIAVKRAGMATYLAANEAQAALSGIPVIGPALGFAARAAIMAAGFANVAAILSESFTGGSTTTSDTASSISETGITDTTTTTSTTTGVINITLNNSSNIETTLEDLNDLLDKGYEINVATAIA